MNIEFYDNKDPERSTTRTGWSIVPRLNEGIYLRLEDETYLEGQVVSIQWCDHAVPYEDLWNDEGCCYVEINTKEN